MKNMPIFNFCFVAVFCIVHSFFEVELFSNENAVMHRNITRLKPNSNKRSLIYILQWTKPEKMPFVYMGKGTNVFQKKRCKFKNCYVTSNRSLLRNISMYDIIAFNGPDLARDLFYELPTERAKKQKYMFVSIESAVNYPICDKRFNNFFNLTWTYKLNSDLSYQYKLIKNETGNLIGPKPIMHWLKVKDMKPISDEFKTMAMSKSKAAAWFVSNCKAKKRMELGQNIKTGLNVLGFDVDIFGKCGTFNCSKDNMSLCHELIREHYFFYFAFENSLSSDYVTEKIIHGLNNYAVPIVYGGANYTRFMPYGIYLDARKLSPRQLAKKITRLILKDREKYYDMFRWHNHYSYHKAIDTPESDPHCKLCELANNDWMKTTTQYPDFIHWWNEVDCQKNYSICDFCGYVRLPTPYHND